MNNTSMKIIPIVNRFGEKIAEVEAADTRDAIEKLVAQSADLRNAVLSGAVLTRADLTRADLRGADLRNAVLRGADLRGADLRGAIGINPYLCTPLLILRDQPGAIRAYKLVDADGWSPIHSIRLQYNIGETYSVGDADTDPLDQCGAGINLATLDWCMREWEIGYRILIAEFTTADIAAIPTATDGKFRCHKATIVGEVDLKEIGLTADEEEPA